MKTESNQTSLGSSSYLSSSQHPLIQIICSEDDAVRNQPLIRYCQQAEFDQLVADTIALDQFWRQTENLYHRVRCLFFLYSIHRFHLPPHYEPSDAASIPYESYQHLLSRRFIEAIDSLLNVVSEHGPNDGISSALAQAYHELAFQTLADQVRKSVRTVSGNQWMFRVGHPDDHPLRIRKELLVRDSPNPLFPILKEKTAVRMDFSHSGWSDIFFLGMDFPQGAQVINASVNLGVMGRDDQPEPPIECYLRVIDRPVIRLTSIDLKATAEIETIAEVFDFAADYLGLLKAAIIAAGIVPPGVEGCGQSIEVLLERMIGRGLGLEVVSKVNDIPKGSRLAVSTNLLGSLISMCMRATGQVSRLNGALEETDRRLIAARAILGEWIGGSGGGWQDSGGVWPGIKLIQGAESAEGDPEYGVSRGRLLPQHTVFSDEEVSGRTRQKLQESLVLVHGGMAQNVGPILEMVTEKYLLRAPLEWEARQEAIKILAEIKVALNRGDIKMVGQLTHRNFFGPLQKIIPWCTNLFTNELVRECKAKYGEQFWGFWMLGGMAGGGMGFIFDPTVKPEAKVWLQDLMLNKKATMESRLPFAMNPVVYDFEINDRGTWGELSAEGCNRMPGDYYAMHVGNWLKVPTSELCPSNRFELEMLGQEVRTGALDSTHQKLVQSILPASVTSDQESETLEMVLARLGFDREQHEQVRNDIQSGKYGLRQNRLPINTAISDVIEGDFFDARENVSEKFVAVGEEAIKAGKVAVVTLSAGVGSRWTEGAGVVKGLHPFCQLSGQHRSFIEVHLAKSRKVGKQFGRIFPHVVTTGYLTDEPIRQHLVQTGNYQYPGDVVVSTGRYVGLRTIPMVRDLQFEWEEVAQQVLDEQKQKMRDSLRAALIGWAQSMGEGTDYRDNAPLQCLHPVGHWYEVPNLIRNGVLKQMLEQQPELEVLMLHNVDTLGASVDPGLLGYHLASEKCLSFEVISRRLEDRGGGLARVNGHPRLVEGLALPNEEDEFKLSFYNSMTTWIHIDRLLDVFGLTRGTLADPSRVDQAIRELAKRMPTYITIKDVKKRWGHGQEDIYPVAQFEKLWSDMSALPEVSSNYLVVPRQRGQQLKEQAQLDGWLRDGTAAFVDSLCDWM